MSVAYDPAYWRCSGSSGRNFPDSPAVCDDGPPLG